MKKRYQFGFDLGLFILWLPVSVNRFAEAVKPLLLDSTQFATVSGAELVPFFNSGLILRDGWRLYRSINWE